MNENLLYGDVVKVIHVLNIENNQDNALFIFARGSDNVDTNGDTVDTMIKDSISINDDPYIFDDSYAFKVNGVRKSIDDDGKRLIKYTAA